jgi:hypothetical protein
MSLRSRILSFGSAGVLVLAGALCAALVSGGAGAMLALVLIGVGFVVAMGLVFLEVGLSEDRERARERSSRSPARPRPVTRARPTRPKLERSRGHQRRLR